MDFSKLAEAVAEGSGKTPKELTLADVDRVKQNRDLMRRMSLKSGFTAMMTGQDKLLVRKMALDTLALARQKDRKLTLETWMERLITIINSRRVETRTRLLSAIRGQYSKK